jgi:hypothetical protein
LPVDCKNSLLQDVERPTSAAARAIQPSAPEASQKKKAPQAAPAPRVDTAAARKKVRSYL